MESLDLAHKELERISAWIGNADTKAGILLALDGGLLALFAGSIERVQDSFCNEAYMLITLILLGSLGFSVYSAIRVLLPDVTVRSDRKLFFFGAIQALPRQDFIAQFQAQSDLDKTTALLDQVHVNSIIASNKFEHLKVSIRALGIAGIAVFVFILFVALA